MNDTINVCLSVNNYSRKQLRGEVDKMRFKRIELSIDEFYERLMQGYAYTSVMRGDWRNRANFECTSTITYDIDHSDTPMRECFEALPLKPTFTYTTSSNCDGDYRYRLVYVVDAEICTFGEYELLSKSLAEQLQLKFIDPRSFLCEQFWFGNASAESIYTGNILELDKIKINNNIIGNKRKPILKGLAPNNIKKEGLSTGSDLTKSISQTIINNSQHYIVSDTFLQDYRTMSFKSLIDKYTGVYENRERTSIDINEDEPIIVYPDDYYEIRRPWKKINGEILKIKDGEGRRRKLYLNGIIRKKIYPDIPFDNLLFNLVYEFYYYYINDGNKIDKKILYEIADNVMKTDIDNYEDLGKPRYKSFINPLYCEKHGLSKKQVLGNVRNKKQYIGEFYDFNLTDQKNIEAMKEYGLNISLITLKRWKKENGIRKNKIINKV